MAPYLGLYLDGRGFSLLEISQLTSILMVTKVVAPNLWGHLADRYQKRLLLVRLGSLATLICFVGFFFAELFWHYALVIILYSFFWNAVLPQFEVVTLYNLGDYRSRYSRVRLWGSIGFIVSVFLLGYLFERLSVAYLPWALLFIIIAILFSSLARFSEPVPLPGEKADHGPTFIAQLLKPAVLVFFGVCLLLQISHGSYYTYYSIYLEKLGYAKSTIGALWSLGVLAEVVLFVYMHRWFRYMRDVNIMLIALVFTSVRWLLIAAFPESVFLLTAAQILHALSFGAMHAAAIHFVHKSFTARCQGRAQAFYSSIGFGLGGALGALMSGLLVTFGSYTLAFYISALASGLAVALILLNRKRFY